MVKGLKLSIFLSVVRRCFGQVEVGGGLEGDWGGGGGGGKKFRYFGGSFCVLLFKGSVKSPYFLS